MPKVIRSTEAHKVDHSTGEVVSSQTEATLQWGSEPPYIKIYLQDILFLSDLPTRHEKILYALLQRANYAGSDKAMELIVNASLKRKIASELDIKVGTISNALTDLVRGEILIRADRGYFELNPYLFGKGNWKDIERLRVEVDYDRIKGRTFKTVLIEKKKSEQAAKNGQDDEMNGQLSFDQLEAI